VLFVVGRHGQEERRLTADAWLRRGTPTPSRWEDRIRLILIVVAVFLLALFAFKRWVIDEPDASRPPATTTTIPTHSEEERNKACIENPDFCDTEPPERDPFP
jgi:hypothetical protein